MGIAIDDTTLQLEAIARDVLEKHGARAVARAMLDSPADRLPDFWSELAGLGWLGLHVGEQHGGQGAGLEELAIVVEQLGACVAPGPFLSTVLTSAVIVVAGTDAQRDALLPGLVDGTRVGTVAWSRPLTRAANGTVSGDAGLVLSASIANLLLVAVGDDLVCVERDAAGVTVEQQASIDLTRPVASVVLSGVAVDEGAILRGAVADARRLGRALAAAEAAGLTRACTDMATAYAKVREQFGRTIGTFQAVKHHCANMLVETESTTAVAYDAVATARSRSPEAELAAACAAALALPAAMRCAKLNSQVHGGISYTWEHDAHLYVRRAQALAAVFGPASKAQEDVTRLETQGVRRRPAIVLPEEAEQVRAEVRAVGERLRAVEGAEQLVALVDSGYAFPHWPTPWGRSAGPVEQLVIDEELHDIPRPQLGIGGWITMTLAVHGTPEQTARFVRQSLLGEVTWCQLFSEPDAGSDAAGIKTRAVRTDGGWLVTGQKIWTSGADRVTHGFATVRTDPDAPKHAGVSMMIIDMHAPGVDVRPLREITGFAQFNEVFLDDVFVPDDDVVGQVNGGWAVARATLGAERVSIGGGMNFGDGHALLPLLAQYASDDVGVARTAGVLLAQDHALAVLNLRAVARAVAGAGPGPEGNVTKLLTAEHWQAVAELALTIQGPDALVTDGVAGSAIEDFFRSRQITIAGGTSEITRNQIAERLLGLPRDPLLR